MDDQSADLILKSLESEPVKNLLGPITKELGLLGGDLAGLVRFYVNSNLEKVFSKWARQREGREPLQVQEVARLIPLLQAASLQSDDELQERWAALLERNVSEPDEVLPSFGRTLSEITAEEAQYLDRLYLYVSKMHPSLDLGGYRTLLLIYDPELSRAKLLEQERHSARPIENFRKRIQPQFDHAHLLIQDLERLGLIVHEQQPTRDDDPLATGIRLGTAYSFSEYGVRFIRAVTPKIERD